MKTIKKLVGVVALAGLFASAHSQAGMIVIDDFSQAQGPLSDTKIDGAAESSQVGNRTLGINATAALDPLSNTVAVGGGILDVTNGTGDDSEVTASWSIGSNLLKNVASAAFNFAVVLSDGNPTKLSFFLDNASLADFSIPGNTSNQNLSFDLSSSAIGALNAGGNLKVVMNGDPGWDLAITQFGISTTINNNVPEPALMGLVGLGLAGFGWRRKRKSA